MSDFYTEQLVKKKKTGSSFLVRALMIVLTIASFYVMLFIPFGIILPVGLIVADFFLFRGQNLEFEYLYVNGELDIDKIIGQAKRKRVFSASISDLEMLAPADSDEINRIQVSKTLDFSTFIPEHKKYALVVLQNGAKVKVIFEPNETILEGYKMLAPRKVVI